VAAVETGTPYRDGTCSWAGPATTTDGRPAVLKVVWPHREARGESIGSRLWAGRGAPLLYAAEPGVYAVLIERCEPGLPLSMAPLAADDRLIAAGTVLRQLWITPPDDHGLERVSDVCSEWAVGVRKRQASLAPRFDPGLVALGADLLESLPASATEDLVVHGDANPTNFLTATRQQWLLIDAKSMVGDPCYDVAPLVLQIGADGQPQSERVLRQRFELLADVLGQPRERLVAWSVARCVESALWYASRNDMAAGRDEMATVATLATLLDA
jgi:streptomycin 6-kinase